MLPEKDDEEKYQTLRRLLEEKTCPVIVYVTRTRSAELLAERLEQDGFSARPYHGKMAPEVKIRNQNDFMSGDVRIIVATSAYGMAFKDFGYPVEEHFLCGGLSEQGVRGPYR